MRDSVTNPLQSGAWFNRSRTVLSLTAVGVALFWIALCVSMAYFVAQYFVCIDGCKAGTPPFLLLAVSTFFGLIPGLGTGAIGYFVVKGLWDDAHRPD
ncbi:MAG TPA: hypothetical protein VNV65_12085 [Candidatus Solibacter sp.]|jgi:hypothetical protein|nr:hypothetical protein [Candidatus Solibacter sp.]